jgi:1,2-diacylglycerol 3-beta-glucosyltransferase
MRLSFIIDVLLTITALPVAAGSAYLLLLTALSRRPRPLALPSPRVKLDVVVPAHDE